MKQFCLIFLSLITSALILSGCNFLGFTRPSSETLVTRGWARNTEDPITPPLYCYDTLGDRVCYTRPLDAQEERLRGYYGPRP